MPGLLIEPQQRLQLEELANSDRSPGIQRRAKIILLYDSGLQTSQVAASVGMSRSRVRFWRQRFSQVGMGIFPAASINMLQTSPKKKKKKPKQAEQRLSPVQPDSLPETISETEAEPLPSPEATDGFQEPPQPLTLENFIASARSIKSPGVSPDDTLGEAGRKILRYHFAQMLLHEDGTLLGADIEELHDMRVATRRMRAAFEVFGEAYKPKILRQHLKGLRATGRALGRVRDLDVFMEKAHHYQDTLEPEHQQDLQPLLHAWQQQRAAAREQMVIYLNSPQYAAFKGSYYHFLSTPGAGALDHSPDQPGSSLVRDITPVLIYNRLAAVRAFDSIMQNATIEQFHALRIEFKKLRYTVEYFREVLGEEARLVINDIKTLQDHLGDLNDAQVATQILRDFLIEWDTHQDQLPVSQRQSPLAVMKYLSYRYEERHQLMQSFHEAWAHFNRPEFRKNLALALSVL